MFCLPLQLLISLTLIQGQDIHAVFVDDAPAIHAELQRIDQGQLPAAQARRRLSELRRDFGTRLVPSPDDEGGGALLFQIDDAIDALIRKHPTYAVESPQEAAGTDPVRAARTAATNGALLSARRWLTTFGASHPLDPSLNSLLSTGSTRSNLETGDALPHDVVSLPIWHSAAEGVRSMPLLAGEVLVLSEPDQVTAVDAITGRPLWHRQTRAADSGGPQPFIAHRAQATPDGDIVAWIGRPMTTGFDGSGRVYRLDARTGAVRWVFDPALFDNATGPLRPSGPPLVADAKVFVPLRRHGRGLTVESWVVALDLETGQPRWHRVLGSAAASMRGVVWPADVLFASNDGILAQTGTGVIATLDPRDGAIDWLRRMPPGRWTTRDASAPPDWSLTRPILCGSTLVTMSPDRTEVVLLNARTGAMLSVLDASTSQLSSEAVLVLPAGPDGFLAIGPTVQHWQLDERATPHLTWSWTDPAARVQTGRPHVAGDQVLLPLGNDIISLAMDTGEPGVALQHPGGGHPVSLNGLLVVAGGQRISCIAGLDAAVGTLGERIDRRPDDVQPRLALVDLAVRANAPELIRRHLPPTLTAAARFAPTQAVAATIDALNVLAPDNSIDLALIEAAISVLAAEGAPLAALHLARGDWLEPVNATAAVDAWIQADRAGAGLLWIDNGHMAAPARALVARRLTRHERAESVVWPPPASSPGARLRAARLNGTPRRADAVAMISVAKETAYAVAAAHAADFSPQVIDDMREAMEPALGAPGEIRHLAGAAMDIPDAHGLLLRDGSTLIWHESPLVEASWTTTVDGLPGRVIAADLEQLVLVVNRLGGGRLLQSLARESGDVRWSLNLDQLADELAPPSVLASTNRFALLGGRLQTYLVDLRDGQLLTNAPTGWPLDAVATDDVIIALLEAPDSHRSMLYVISADGRVIPWRHPVPIPDASWLSLGPLHEVILGTDNAMGFAPGPNEPWWWVVRTDGTDPLRGAIVLPDIVLARTRNGDLLKVSPEDGALQSRLERPIDDDAAPLSAVVHQGDGVYVVRDVGVSKHAADGTLLWADVPLEKAVAPMIVRAGDETLLIQEQDILQDPLLPTEARTTHRIRRLDRYGRLTSVIELFPMATGIRHARTSAGMLLLSDDLDTWLVPLPPPPDPSSL